MSTITDNARIELSKDVYLYGLQKSFGVMAGMHLNFFEMYNRNMILKVLEWNDVEQYLSPENVDCLESQLRTGHRSPCNCNE